MKKKLSIFCSLLLVLSMIMPLAVMPVFAEGEETDTPAESKYTELESPAVTYNMNVDWKFRKSASGQEYPLAKALAGVAKNGKQFYEDGYDDSDWDTVSVPHPINAEDSFDGNAYDAGEAGLFRGFMFYRKYVTIPAEDSDKKLFLEFESARNSVYLYVNGNLVGYYDAGIAPVGFDITDYVKAGEANLIAVATDNCADRGQSDSSKVTHETKPGSTPGAADGYGYQWNTKDFNEVQGGLTGNVNLYAKGKIYQTLPLYNNLKTTGNYIYGSDYDIDAKSATINVKAEIRNEDTADADITVQVDVVGMDGKLAGTFTQTGKAVKATDADAHFQSVIQADAYDSSETYTDDKGEHTVASGATPTTTETVKVSYITASQKLENLRFWSDKDPYLYTVYTYLKNSNGDIIDAQKTVTGFRKVEYTLQGGLKINDKYTYLKGYAQRSTNEWAVVGVANDWLTDIDMQLLKDSNGNHIRWMHVAPKPVEVRSSDKYGVIVVAPAGDKEADVHGRTWDQRVEAMRDTIIYFRNSPSVLFWEAGNNAVSAAHMQEMTDLKALLDPNGGRFMGSRTISSVDQIKAAEYVGTMLNRNASAAKTSMASAGDKYMPVMETEYARDEAPRRVWDDFSPPDYDYVNKWLGSGASKTDGYDIWDETSEDFAVINAKAYDEFWSGRVTGGGSELYSGAAIMVWSDSNMHNRNTATENCRTSGKVDAVRIKKEAFYALQAVQSDEPKIHIVGHWNYPQLTDDTYWYNEKKWNANEKYWEYTTEKKQRDPKNKTVYVIGSPDIKKVELYINDELIKTDSKPDNSFVYAFNEIDVTQSGEISAKAYDETDTLVAEDAIATVGAPDHVKLTPVTGPDGLIADGSDIMYYDVAIVDEDDNVCPLSYDRIDLKLSGEGVLLGGYNSGVGDKITTNKVTNNVGYTNAECGVNRVFIRSTRNAGTITLTATVDGLGEFSANLASVAYENKVGDNEGLSTQLQRSYAADEKPPVVEEKVEAFKPLAAAVKANFSENGNTKVVKEVDTNVYYAVSVNGEAIALADELRARASSVSGTVYGPAGPVIEKLKAIGAVKDYSITSTTPKVLSFTTNNDNTYTVRVGQNAIHGPGLPDEGTEINEEASEFGGEIFLNYNAVFQGYISGVRVELDETAKTCDITYSAPTLSSVDLYDVGTASVTYTDGKVTVKADNAIENAKLIFAVYDNGKLTKVDTSVDVTVAAGESKTIDAPEAIASASGTKKVMLWTSLDSMLPLCAAVTEGAEGEPKSTLEPKHTIEPAPTEAPDLSAYEKVQYTEDFNSNTQTDGPDGTGYFQSKETDELIYSGVGDYLASDSLFSMDFRFDTADATMRMSNGKNKTGPFFSLNGTTLRTQTGGSSYQDLGTVEVGKWYKMEIEGKMGVSDAHGDFRLYEYKDGTPVLINTVNEMKLRNFGNGTNGYSDNMKASLGISADNVKITSLYANEVTVTAIKDEIKANESVQLTAIAKRKGAAVTPPEFEWTVLDAEGNELTGDAVTVTEGGMLLTTADAETQTVTVRATAKTEGKPYGEKQIKIIAIDTSNDTFDAITVESDKNYVRFGQDTTITPTVTLNGEAVTPAADDIVWSIYNEANIREVKNIGIKVENGVVSVEDFVIPQVITVRASNKSGSAVATVKLNIKPGNMILDDEEGNADVFVAGDACEELVTGIDLQEGSWDGTGYYKLITEKEFPGFASNTSEHVLYSADMRFDKEGAGWIVYSNDKGKVGMQVKYTGGKLGIVQDSSKTPTYLDVNQTSWYNVQIMCSTGASSSYAHLIVYEYDEKGNKINPDTGEKDVPFIQQFIPMRNLGVSPANHLGIQGGTSVDNVYCAKTSPDDIEVTADKDTMFAGQSIQGSVTATRKGVPFGYISSDLIKWIVYDENNEKALGSDLITVDASGKMTVDALADSQVVYLRAATLDGTLYDAVKITISSSDIFTVNTIGFNEDYTKVVELDVTKNFSYSDNVTFVVAVYDKTETTLKSVTTKTMSAKNIARGEEPTEVSIDAPMPADFDKTQDVVYVYTVTSVSENEAVTEADGTVAAEFVTGQDNAIQLTKTPEFDASRPVIVLVLKPGATTTSVNDSDIAFIKQVTGATLNSLGTISLNTDAAGDYIIKLAGKIDGVSVIATGVVAKP